MVTMPVKLNRVIRISIQVCIPGSVIGIPRRQRIVGMVVGEIDRFQWFKLTGMFGQPIVMCDNGIVFTDIMSDAAIKKCLWRIGRKIMMPDIVVMM